MLDLDHHHDLEAELEVYEFPLSKTTDYIIYIRPELIPI